MARGIRLNWASSRYVFGKHDGIRLRIDASDACEMSDKIFAYRMRPLNPATGEQVGFFSHICSPVDLEEYPESEPVTGQRPEWFRLAYVDVLVRSIDELGSLDELANPEEVQGLLPAVVQDVRRLVRTLNTMDTLIPAGQEDIGDICPPASSTSSVSDSSAESEPSAAASDGPLQTLTAHGTNEQSVGDIGTAWLQSGTGAGSAVGDANFSHTTLYPAFSSQLLIIKGFDFSELPDDAQIAGISASLAIRWVEQDDELSFCPQLSFLALHQPEIGLIESDADNDCLPGPAYTDIDVGGSDDLWDEVWTPALLKQGDFGLAVMVTLPVEAGVEIDLATVQVDGAEITIHYR